MEQLNIGDRVQFTYRGVAGEGVVAEIVDSFGFTSVTLFMSERHPISWPLWQGEIRAAGELGLLTARWGLYILAERDLLRGMH